ncbi:MAG: fructosamine kinase family protein, partial [Bacteroidota bacterium]
MLPDPVRQRLEAAVGTVRSARRVGGGDVSAAARVEASGGIVLAKWNAGAGGDSFEAEAEGLAALRATAEASGADLIVPDPLLAENRTPEAEGLLVLPWIEPGAPTPEAWRRFGRSLATLHRADPVLPPEALGANESGDPAGRPYGGNTGSDGPYGWAHDNWIGSKPQRNGWADDWPAFFGERRLLAQAETVRTRGAWRAEWDGPLARLVARLPEILPARPHPSLLHGDLWAGNALAAADGRFALIDPAVSVGDREADLGMTRLFGGFAAAFYDGTAEAWPLAPEADTRMEVYNLFHRINHLTHGAGY